jgi:hypothetical protein
MFFITHCCLADGVLSLLPPLVHPSVAYTALKFKRFLEILKAAVLANIKSDNETIQSILF